jgi:hypothetical protein
MIDLRQKQFLEEEAEKQSQRMKSLEEIISKFLDELILKEQIKSFEYLFLLNNLMFREINARISQGISLTVQKKIAVQDQILQKKPKN